jgi:predicted TIM-barrel fold metal-dependent hydrolase
MTGGEQSGPFGRIMPPRGDWLAAAEEEEILDPDLPIIDPHHHFWDASGLSGEAYLLDEWRRDVGSGHNVEATVYIECETGYRADGPIAMRPVGEVEYIAELTAGADGDGGSTCAAAGIIGLADLTLGEEVDPVLAAMESAGAGRFKGIRQGAGWDDDPIIGNNHAAGGPGLYLRQGFRRGLSSLSKRNLSFDALAFHPQLMDVVDLARACPDASLIVNHTGMPLGYGPYAGKADEVHRHWATSMRELATCPNVTMKLGGMMMRLASFDYHTAAKPPTSAQLADLWRPYIEASIEWFGADRCMFESNFPVDKMGIGYAALWNAFKRIAAGASDDEKRALFADTARRAYRLDPC